MRVCWFVLVLLLGLSACGSSSAASSSTSGPGTDSSPSTQPSSPPPSAAAICGPRDGRTIAASRQARVYSLGGGVYGCTRTRSYRLGAAARSIRKQRVGPVAAVAGEDAAYTLTTTGIDTGTTDVLVRELANGAVLHDVLAIHHPLPEAFQSVGSIVVKADGAVAWISQINSLIRQGDGGVAVMRIDSRGQAVLDSGAAIRVRSLRLQGSTLTWRDGSRTRSAKLD